MADDESSAPRSAPVVLRIKLRYDDVDTMVHRFAANVGRSGLFLPTKSIQPIGAEVKFELRLANDTPVLVGQGRVKATRDPDASKPRAAFGMSVELMRVTRESRAVILRMLERRRQVGLPDLALPMPDDIDVARRLELDSAVREADAIPREASGPTSGPAEGLLTAPRRSTGPFATSSSKSDGLAVAALAPEAPRRRRPRVSEVVERAKEASGRMAAAMSVLGIDEHVDVERAMLRARSLATGDVDAELASLRDAMAAPIAISVEAASAELARQLGGAAVGKRDRSGGERTGHNRWAPPPEVVKRPAEEVARETFSAAIADGEEERAAPQMEAPVVDAPIVDVPQGRDDDSLVAAEPIAPAEVSVVEDAAALIESEAEASSVDTNPSEHVVTPPPSASSLLIDDDVDPARFEQRDNFEDDYNESTQIGALPIAPEGYATIPAEIGDRVEAHLDEAEAEGDHVMSGAPGFASEYETMPPDEAAVEPVHLTEPSARHRVAALAEEEPEEEIMEIDDFEILAEADAEDADLLLANGEADAPADAEAQAAPVPAPGGSGELDFGDLDLGDDSAIHRPVPAFDNDDLDRALEADTPSNFTIAGPPIDALAAAEFDAPHAFSPPPSYDAAALSAPTLDPRRDADLESALADLDVDFDDFGAAESPIHRVRPRAKREAKPARPTKPRANTDDGVLIDFDDDE